MLFSILLMLAIIFWGLVVLRSSNAVHSVLSLVLVFALTAILFLLLGAEFFALLIFTVYIGAIAILFLFVIMMLDLRLAELHGSVYYHVPLGASVGLAFLAALYSLLAPEIFTLAWADFALESWTLAPQSNLKVLGQGLYNYYLPYVFAVTLILLLAMVAVIALTLDAKQRRPSRPNAQRPSKGNFFWTTFELCHTKHLVKPLWWREAPSLARFKNQTMFQLRKWSHVSLPAKSHDDNDSSASGL